MLVSVIIAAYNYEKYIAETLQSIIAQTHQSWECIVVDDGSTDNTEKAVAEIAQKEPRIKYIYQANQGASAARNNGLKHASGDYIQFLDADDLLERKKLEVHVNFLNENRHVDICYGDARYFPSDNPQQRWFRLTEIGEPWIHELNADESVLAAFVTNNIPINTALLRRNVINHVGVFDERIKFVEDWDFWFRCAKHEMSFQFIRAEETLALIRSHGSSLTQIAKRRFEHLSHLTFLRNKFAQSLTSQPKLLRLNTIGLADNIANFGIAEITDKRIQNGIRLMFKAIVYSPNYNAKLKLLMGICLVPFLAVEDWKRFLVTPVGK
jgi:glycosyltransferase involved in cell wall biosynthesis